MDTKEIFDDMEREMQKSVDHVLHEFAALHTGKANTSMVEGVNVDVYGSSMKLRDVAAITTPDARTIQIQPWGFSFRESTRTLTKWPTSQILPWGLRLQKSAPNILKS